jgi:hypothetical protein
MADQTAQELIDAALRLLMAVDPGETPTTTERNNGLQAMKIMLRSWAAEGLAVYYSVEDTKTLTAGTQSYTIGSGGDIDTARPVKIDTAFVASGGLDYPLIIGSRNMYAARAQKDLGYDIPEMIWYNPGYPLGTVYIYPPGGGVLHIWSQKQLSEFDLTDDVTFPGEYDRAIKFNLAVEMAPEYGGLKDPALAQMAMDAKRAMENNNLALSMEPAAAEVMRVARRYHIDQG